MSSEEEIRELANKAEQLRINLSAKTKIRLEIEETIKRLQKQTEQRIAELKSSIESLNVDAFKERTDLRAIERSIETKEKELEAEAHAKKLADSFTQIQEKLGTIKEEYFWGDKILKHQDIGSDLWTHRKRIILADPMGLGKTLTAISALDKIKAATEFATKDEPYITDALDRFPVNKPAGKRVLYLSSAELSRGVYQEFLKWAPHRNVLLLTSQNKVTRNAILNLASMAEEFVIIVNFESWKKDLKFLDQLAEINFDTVIVDEAHKIKSATTNSSKGVNSILSRCDSFFRILMTGTPILNKPQEFFQLLQTLDPYRFYDLNAFLDEFCILVTLDNPDNPDKPRLQWRFKEGGVEALYKKVGAIFLRRTCKDAGIVLPPQSHITHELDIDETIYPNQARARSEMRTWGSIMLDPENSDKGAISAIIQLSVIMRLRQIETWPAGIQLKDPKGNAIVSLDIHESQKLDYVLNPVAPIGLISELLEGEERVVVFSQFSEALKELHKRAINHGYRSALFIGDTKANVRNEIKDDFDRTITDPENSKYEIVFANYKLGGEGLNITGATQTIELDEEWNPGKRDQARGRTDRIGQTQETTVHTIRMNGTIDDWMARIIEEKEEMLEGFDTQFDTNMILKALKEGAI